MLNYKVEYLIDDEPIDTFYIEIGNLENNDFIVGKMVSCAYNGTLYQRTYNGLVFLNDTHHINLDLYLKDLEKILSISLGCTTLRISKVEKEENDYKLLRIYEREQMDCNYDIYLKYDNKNETWYIDSIYYQDDWDMERDELLDILKNLLMSVMNYTNKDVNEYKKMIKKYIDYYLKGKWEIVNE